MANSPLPHEVRQCLWSYQTGALDTERDKHRIIFSVLNHGGKKAALWVFKTYPRKDIVRVIENTPKSEWSKESLNLWTTTLHARPAHETRFS